MRDHRRHIRVGIKSVADVVSSEGQFNDACVGGISRGGLELYTRDLLHKEATYTIKPYFIFEGQEMLETLKGTVKWSLPIRNMFVSGIEFIKSVTPESCPALSSCIEQSEAYNNYFFVKK